MGQKRQGNQPATEWPDATWAVLGAGGLITCLEDIMKWEEYLEGEEYLQTLVDYQFFKQVPGSSFYQQIATGAYGQFGIFRYFPENEVTMLLFSNSFLDNEQEFLEITNAVQQELF